MFEGLVFHDSHNGGNTESVVGSEGGSLCLHPFAIDISLDWIGLEVVCAVGRLLRHHVHMGLKYNALLAFHAWSGGLAHHDIVGCILKCLHSHTGSEVDKELLYFFQMS